MIKLTKARYQEWIRLYGQKIADQWQDQHNEQYLKFSLELKRQQESNKQKPKKKYSKELRKAYLKRKKQKKENRKLINRQKKERLQGFANKLETKLPKSEVWFRDLYLKHFSSIDDKFNEVFFNRYIPDVINKKHKYIIEIDGSIHDNKDQIIIDFKKDQYYKSKGYRIFRLKAYDISAYIHLIKILSKIRNQFPTKDFEQFTLQYEQDMLTRIDKSTK